MKKYLNTVRGVMCCLLFVLLIPSRGTCQNKFNVIESWLRFSDASNSLYHYLSAQAFNEIAKRDSLVSKIYTLPEWKHRQQWERKTFLKIVGPFPERTPLNPVITQKIKKEGYTIEDIIYESQPGFYVTSSLFIPANVRGKAPAILYCSGHTPESYRDPDYQRVILNLVMKGFIVFAFDPVGQGERLQYYDKKSGQSKLGQPSAQHSFAGSQAFITGSSLARYMIWDGIRAIDYLLTRKEVDPKRIGITGQSGGGTQSAYIAALDNRILAEAPSSYITSFSRLIEAIGPQDAEQTLTNEIAKGLGQADLLEVRAPKPALMLTTTRDFFPIQGSVETAKEVARIYEAYKMKAHFRMAEDDAPHQWTKKTREAMYAFFQKYLDNPGDSTDTDIKPLPDRELQVTGSGQVAASFENPSTVFSLNRRDAEKHIHSLESLRKDSPEYLRGILKSAKQLSGYRSPSVFHKPVFTGRYEDSGYVTEKYFVQGEGDYVIPYLLMVPEKPNGKAVICLNPENKSEEVSNGDIKWLVQKGYTVLSPDLLGTGETGHGYIDLRQSTLRWFLSILVHRSIVGIQAGDIVRLVKVLKKENGIQSIYGLARGTMCAPLLYAAAFDTSINRILLDSPLVSYRSVVMERFYDPHFIAGAVAGSLTVYDLPDLAASLAPRKLVMINVLDGKGMAVSDEVDRNDLAIIKAAYSRSGAVKQLLMPDNNVGEDRFGNVLALFTQ